MYDARQIANFFLDVADQRGIPVTVMALLKLIYYAHGWYMAENDEPLIDNRFEAWRDGPVVKIIYRQFKENEDKAIRNRAYFFDPLERSRSIAEYEFPDHIITFLRSIFDEYVKYHAFTLSSMTHAEGGPWDKVWNDQSDMVNPGMVIENSNIKQYFRSLSSTEVTH